MSQKFKSDIETQAGLIDSFGFTGTAGQVLSSTGTKTEWITPPQTPGGGGSSQVFYFNGGTVSSVGGYYQMSPVANTGTAADFTINANGYIASFLTDVASPNQLNIPAGNWNFEIYFSASSSGGSPSFYVELYKYSSGGVFTLIASSSAAPEGITNGTAIDAYFTPLAVPTTTLLATDRLAVRVYVTHSGRTITMHTQNGHLSEVITTFSTGLTALNGLTEQVQYFSTGTAGTDFNIASAVNTHTFNLPTASATNRGALSSADWITFNSKANASGTTNYVSKFTGTTTLGNSLIYDNGTNVGIGTTSPAAKLDVSVGQEVNGYSLAGYPFLKYSSGDVLDYGAFGNTWQALRFLTNGSERMRVTASGNVGIGTTSPTAKLDVNGTGRFSGQLNIPNNIDIAFGTISGNYIGQYYNGTDLLFYNGTGGSNLFGINRASGAATFSSSVTASGFYTPGFVIPSSVKGLFNNTNYSGPGWNNASLVTGNGATGVMMGGDTASYTYGWIQGVQTDNGVAKNLSLQPLGGNVGIGTTSPNGKLEIRGIESNTKDLLLNLSKFAYGTTQFYQNYSNTFYTAGKSLEIEVEALPLLQLAVNNAGSQGKVIFPNGNVGIGTSSPTTKLEVTGNIKASLSGYELQIYPAWDTGVAGIGTSSNHGLVLSTNSTEKMRITSSGNVGIGTTSPAYQLDVASSGRFAGLLISNDRLWLNGNTVISDWISSGLSAGYSQTNSYGWINGAGNLILGTNGSERMRIDSSGNVGIGTSSPQAKLHINNGTDRNLWFRVNGSGTGTELLSINDAQSTRQSLAFSASSFYFDNGNVGIGTTNPQTTLEVLGANEGEYLRAGAGTITDRSLRFSNFTVSGLTGVGHRLNAPNANANLALAVGGTDRLYINNSGNVGIGTTSPVRTLDVNGEIRTRTGTIDFSNDFNNQIYVLTNSMNFKTNGSDKMVITSGGNVGIGTTSPNASAILHLRSTIQGFLPPVMRTGERNGISNPAVGLMIFNEEEDVVQVFTNGEGWRTLAWA
jgi:hypothetical protein